MINADSLNKMKTGVILVNVARGGLINEAALLSGLKSEKIASVALDVMQEEPLPLTSELRQFENCIFGSHNASNTKEAVERTSLIAIDKLFNQLNLV